MQGRQRIITFLLAAYLVIMVGFMISRNLSITPDRFFVVLLFAALIVGRTRVFLKDWIPFIALILAYEMLRGFADTTGFKVHIGELINLEQNIFGFIPTVELQKRFFDPNQIAWWDIGAVIVNFLHFPLPLIIAFYLWLKDRKAYWMFIIALLTLSFAGFVTYLLYPAAPPWYASQRAGLIEAYKIIDFVIAQVGWRWDFSYIYNNLNPNQVAAMPSLHSAYPWLSFLALRAFNKKLAWFFLPYPFLVWLSVVYSGEHYVIDVVAGIIFASVVYLIIYKSKILSQFIVSVWKALNIENGKPALVKIGAKNAHKS